MATGTIVPMPVNPTAWLIANARRGAMLYTRDGVTVAMLDTPTTWTDPDTKRTVRPVFATYDGNGTRRSASEQAHYDWDGRWED